MAKDISLIVYVCICIQLVVSISGESCDKPPVAERSRPCEKEEPPFPVGKSIKYCCNSGFRFRGNNRFATCKLKENGDTTLWDIPDLQCQPVSCSPPDPITNGRVVGNRYTFPNSVKYECNKGYKLRGVNQRYCETNGEWSGRIPECHIITCPRPDNIENGTVSFTSTEYSSVATYQCSPGFGIRGNDNRRCTHEGVWDGDIPTCVKVTCPEPNDPVDGKVTLVNGGTHKGNFISYTCNEGTSIRGASFATCMDDGRWSADTPICARPCTLPKLYRGKIGRLEPGWRGNNLKFSEKKAYSKIEDGETLLLRCNQQFELPVEDLVPGDVDVVCERGILKPAPACHPAWCRYPLPDNGVGTPPFPPYNKENGSVIEYEDACLNIGNTLQKKKALCYRGTWLITEATCQDIRCKGKDLEDIFVDTSGKQFYEDGERLEVKCKNRFEPSSEAKTILCVNGQWEITNNPCKPASCRYPPPEVDGAQALVTSGEHGTVVDYLCSPPYRLVARKPVTCSYGQWIGEMPSCSDTRCYTNRFNGYDGVKPENKSIADKELYTPSCMDEYDSLNIELECRKGIWGGQRANTKFCTPGDCIVPYVAYGEFYVSKLNKYWLGDYITWERVNANSVASHNSEFKFNCRDGRKFQGKFETGEKGIKVTCNKKQWIPKPSCWFFPQTTTVAPTTIDNPIENRSDVNEAELLMQQALNNSTASNNHDNNVSEPVIPNLLIQNLSRNCEFKNTDKYLLIFFNNQVTHSGNLIHGSVLKFGCQPIGMMRLSGPGSANCTDGEWEPESFPTCVVPAGENSVTVAVYSSTTYDTYPGDVARVPKHSRVGIQCFEKNQKSRPHLVCINREYSFFGHDGVDGHYGTVFTYIIISNFTEEYSVNCSCYSGSDSHTITLLINDDIGSQDIVCPQLNATNHLSITYDPPLHNFLPNTKASFTCRDARYELNGTDIIACLENGRWSSDPPTCVRVQNIVCPQLPATNHLSITYDPLLHNFLPNTKASFTCRDARYELRGTDIITCLENGRWSSDPPTCVRRCWPRPNITNGDKEGDSINVGSVVTYSCRKGFKLIGPRQSICKENGEWSNRLPWCSEIRCPVPIRIPNGYVRFSSLQFNSQIEYICNEGYKLIGESKLWCMQNEKWSSNYPVCKEDLTGCSSHYLLEILPEGTFGLNITADHLPEGSVVQLVCGGKLHVMIGSKYAICSSNGSWKVGDTKCVPGCNTVEKPSNSSLIIENTKETYRFGDDLTFSCPEGQELSIDSERIVCLGTGWSDERVPTCIPLKA